jgi:acyl-CoA reductase-like NAD-dependent aldehyde dehydrogenase
MAGSAAVDTSSAAVPHWRMLIGDKWVEGVRSRRFSVINPATELELATVAEAEADDVSRAVEAANAALVCSPVVTVSAAAG